MLSITAGTLWQKRTGATADLRTNTAVQYLGAASFTLPVALLTETGRLDPTPALLFGLAWSVLGMSIAAIGLFMLLIRRGAVAGVAALLYLVPPVSALMAYALFGETLAPVQMAGMVVAALLLGLPNLYLLFLELGLEPFPSQDFVTQHLPPHLRRIPRTPR